MASLSHLDFQRPFTERYLTDSTRVPVGFLGFDCTDSTPIVRKNPHSSGDETSIQADRRPIETIPYY